MSVRRAWVAAAALALCLALPFGTAAQTVTVSVEPAETRVAPGEACTLYVHVGDEVDSLSCAGIHLGFDSTVVSCLSASKGELFTTAPFPTFFNDEVPSADTVVVEACVLGYRTYILAPGNLFAIVFEALETGITDVTVGQAQVWDIDRNPVVEGIGQSGRIIVTTQTGGTPPPLERGKLSSFPNPFNPVTTIVLELPEGIGEGVSTEIGIYDTAGRLVRRLFSGRAAAGRSEFQWNGRSESGSDVSSGIYLAVSKTGTLRMERKLVLLR
jgi:hypothetical protein